MCCFQQKTTGHANRKKHTLRRKACVRLGYGVELELSDWESEITMMNMLRALMEKVGNMQEQVVHIQGKIET